MPNREISITQTDINNLDVWVQTINTAGEVLDNWVRVPAVSGSNIVYNSVQKNTRKIFVVESDVDNSIVIRFADGEFGDVPYGILRVWYRQSINKSF